MNRSQPLRRTPLARASGLPRVAGLRRRPQRPPERPAHLDVPEEVRQALHGRSRGLCEAAIAGVCSGPATDLHHRQRRGVGFHPHRITNCLALCREDHAWIHAHPEQARDAGWIVSAYSSEPSRIPVLIRGTLRLLAADGSYLDREGL